eukprot:gene1621-2265_t
MPHPPFPPSGAPTTAAPTTTWTHGPTLTPIYDVSVTTVTASETTASQLLLLAMMQLSSSTPAPVATGSVQSAQTTSVSGYDRSYVSIDPHILYARVTVESSEEDAWVEATRAEYLDGRGANCVRSWSDASVTDISAYDAYIATNDGTLCAASAEQNTPSAEPLPAGTSFGAYATRTWVVYGGYTRYYLRERCYTMRPTIPEVEEAYCKESDLFDFMEMLLRYRHNLNESMSAASAQDVEAPYFNDGSAYRKNPTGRTLARSVFIFLLILCITFVSLYSRASVAELRMCSAYDALDRQVHFAYAALRESLSNSESAGDSVCAFDPHTSVLRITSNASQTLALYSTTLRADRTQYLMTRDAQGFAHKTVVSMELAGVAYMMRAQHCPVALSEVRMADVTVSVDTESTVRKINVLTRGKIAECLGRIKF